MAEIFNQVLSMTFDASVLIFVVTVIRSVTKRLPKMFRKVLWGLVGLRLLIPFSFKSKLSLMPHNSTTFQNIMAEAEKAIAESPKSIIDYLPIIWLIVTCIFLLYGIISFIKLKIKITDAVKETDNVYLSEKINSPFVCGFIKPKIFFPYNIDGETKECILQHERLHIKYGDHILKSLAFVILCIYWFNPLVWLAYFLFCKDIELACDEAVIKNYTETKRKKYASAILEVGVNKVQLSACPVAFGEIGIKERVKSTIYFKKATKAAIVLCLALIIAIVLGFMTEPIEAKFSNKESPSKAEVSVSEPTTEPTTEPSTEAVTEPQTQPPITTEPASQTTAKATTKKHNANSSSGKTTKASSGKSNSNSINHKNNKDEKPSLTTDDVAKTTNIQDFVDNENFHYYDDSNDFPYNDYYGHNTTARHDFRPTIPETIIIFY